MKRNFDAPMLQLDGTPYSDGATLKSVAFAAISASIPGDEHQPVDEKMALYALAGKVVKGGIVDVDTNDLALLEKRIGKAYPALVVGEAFRLIRTDFVEA